MEPAKVAKTTLTASAVGAMLLAAGCSAVTPDYRDGTRPTQTAAPSRVRCPKSAAQLPASDDLGRMIGPGRVPDGFRPVRVVRCTWSETYLDDPATRSRITMEELRSPTVTTALSASLELPDQELVPSSRMACAAIATDPQYLILVAAEGRAFVPRLPESPCRDPRAEVVRALADLQWTDHQTYRFEAAIRE